MQRRIRWVEIWVYLLCLVISYHVVGVLRYSYFVTIDLADTATLLQKVKVFYVGEFSGIICPAVLMSIFMMIIILLLMKDD